MSKFTQTRQVKGQGFGEKMRRVREDHGQNLEDIAQEIGIQAKYLQMLEEGDLARLPGEVYAKAWIKKYSQYLGLAEGELLGEYQLERNISKKINQFSKPSKKQDYSDAFWLRPRNIRNFIIIIAVSAVLTYLGWEINNIVAAPSIDIIQPSNNFTTSEGQIEIVGKTAPETEVMINQERALTDEQGLFRQTVNLTQGLNKLEISAKKKHSQTRVIEWNILRQE